MVALFRLTQRYIRRRRIQSLLFVLGVALGVAVGVAIDLANRSASAAFDLSVRSVTGRTTHQIVGASGSISTSLYTRLRSDWGMRTSAPVIESYVRVEEMGGRSMRLLGIDPLAEAPFRDYLTVASGADPGTTAQALYDFVARPNTALLSADLAAQYALAPGDTITIEARKNPQATLVIAGLLSPQDRASRQALRELLLVDIATAQEVAGQPGEISRIDLILPDSFNVEQLAAWLPAGTTIITPSQNAEALRQMAAAFKLNLQALSLLALLVGMFLIYNTVSFSVVQRRPVLGILRSLGATRQQLFILVALEAVVLGAIGTGLGLALGTLMGQGAVRLVSQTINDLYFRVTVEQVTINQETLLRGALIGLLTSVSAALLPALEATTTPPVGVIQRSRLEQRTLRRLPVWSAVSAALVVSGYALLRLDSESIMLALAALLTVLLGSALLTPVVLVALARGINPAAGRVLGVVGRMAPRSVARSLSRTGIAVAALTLTVSTVVGISAMISSFRTTLTDWLTVTLGADIYISPYSEGGNSIAVDIDPELPSTLAKLNGIARVASVRSVNVRAPTYPELPPVNLVAPDTDITNGKRRFAWLAAPGDDFWAALEKGQVIVSEPFAHRRHITPAQNQITLLTEQGPHTFTVAGVFYDYTTDQGILMMHYSVYRHYFNDPYLSAIALDLQPGTNVEEVLEQLRTGILRGTGLQAQSNRQLRASVLAIFDRTFAITVALRLLAIVVAFIGILSALMALQLENTHEYGILRATGMTPRQLSALTFLQTGLMGLTAGLLAVPVGVILAIILIYEINVRSFGWSMSFAPDAAGFIQAIGVALIAALAAGVYPAWRIITLPAASAIRSE
ncbi:MAG: ABC transporter permease [Aggregatilineaceae bacterium]